jgi:hypothetical protein
MENLAKFYFTEEELLYKVGFNKETSVISKIEFDQENGDVEITVRSSEEVQGITGKSGNVRRTKLFNGDMKIYDVEQKKWIPCKGQSYNITINTCECDKESAQKFLDKFVKGIKDLEGEFK